VQAEAVMATTARAMRERRAFIGASTGVRTKWGKRVRPVQVC